MSAIIPLSLADGKQAIVYVRQHAGEWGISPNRIGMIGFSAGGTLAGVSAFDTARESRLDFVAPIYAYVPPFVPKTAQKDAPPLFVAAASDDELHLVPMSLDMYSKWLAAGRSAEIHIYSRGGHGFGMNPQHQPSDTWIDRFGDWLGVQGLLAGAAQGAPVRGMGAQKTENVVVITLDGLRWQEMFTGADSILINDSSYTRNPARLKEKYWAATAEERRRRLFPFIWDSVAGQGQIHDIDFQCGEL